MLKSGFPKEQKVKIIRGRFACQRAKIVKDIHHGVLLDIEQYPILVYVAQPQKRLVPVSPYQDDLDINLIPKPPI